MSDALSPQASHVRPEQQTREQRDVGRLDQDTSPESSDEEATLDLRAARLFRDESASGFGYFGKTIESSWSDGLISCSRSIFEPRLLPRRFALICTSLTLFNLLAEPYPGAVDDFLNNDDGARATTG